MENNDRPKLSLEDVALDDLSLEPIEDQPSRRTAAKFKIDTRSKSDRRQTPDRRSDVRFEVTRRSGRDRRVVENPWGPGADI